jgi:hypothetical protein
VACHAAHALCKRLKKPVCAIVGIHVDNITSEEITQIIKNCEALAAKFVNSAIGPSE